MSRTSSSQAPAAGPRYSRIVPSAPLTLRLWVRARRFRLDREIAEGAVHPTSAGLELRARQLISARTRCELARNLRGLVEHVERPHPIFSAVVVHRNAVSAGAHALIGLAESLEREEPVSPAGVARVRMLLTDGVSPLFNPSSRQTVIDAVWDIQDALEERDGLAQHLH
jgi:hypothetical protein